MNDIAIKSKCLNIFINSLNRGYNGGYVWNHLFVRHIQEGPIILIWAPSYDITGSRNVHKSCSRLRTKMKERKKKLIGQTHLYISEPKWVYIRAGFRS